MGKMFYIVYIMSIEKSTYTISIEEEKYYELDKIDLPNGLFDDLYDVFNPVNQINKYNINLKNIFLEATIFEGSKRYSDLHPRYKTYKDRLTIDDGPEEGFDGVLIIKCKFCKKLFIPQSSQVSNRIRALNGGVSEGSENNFYCSQECKNKCPIYNKHSIESDIKYKRDSNFIKQANEIVLEKADYKCEICGDTENLEVHHIKPFKTNPLEAYDTDNLICLCKKHHRQYGHSDRECTTGYLAKCKINE